MSKVWKDYDPTWLVNAAEKYRSEYPWLPSALSKCTTARIDSDFYIYFVDSDNPNKPESEWQFDTNLTIEESAEGELVLDILEGDRVGGVELLSKL